MDGKRNAPLTNAERQRRYRDKQRGGPTVGRWAITNVETGETVKTSMHKFIRSFTGFKRSMYFMTVWLSKYAPGSMTDAMVAHGRGECSVTHVYQRLKADYFRACVKAVLAGGEWDTITIQWNGETFVWSVAPPEAGRGRHLAATGGARMCKTGLGHLPQSETG